MTRAETSPESNASCEISAGPGSLDSNIIRQRKRALKPTLDRQRGQAQAGRALEVAPIGGDHDEAAIDALRGQ